MESLFRPSQWIDWYTMGQRELLCIFPDSPAWVLVLLGIVLLLGIFELFLGFASLRLQAAITGILVPAIGLSSSLWHVGQWFAQWVLDKHGPGTFYTVCQVGAPGLFCAVGALVGVGIGWLLRSWLYHLFVFSTGIILTFITLFYVFFHFGWEPHMMIIISFAIVGGFLCLSFLRHVMIVTWSLVGANLIMLSIFAAVQWLHYLNWVNFWPKCPAWGDSNSLNNVEPQILWLYLGIWLFLTLFGVHSQVKISRPKKAIRDPRKYSRLAESPIAPRPPGH